MRWLVFFVALVALLVGLLLLPQPASTLIILLLLLLSLGVALNRAGYLALPLAVVRAFVRINLRPATTHKITDDPLPSTRKSFLLAAEIVSILLMTAYVTRPYYQSPGLQLSGSEAEWLTSSAYAAHNGLRQYGRIPLWQPYLEFGEPLIDNPFSFIVNPFSSVPSLLLGGAEGIKISVVLTTAVAGLGGWFLGYVLGFAWVGRVLLGMLLVGKGNMLTMFNTGYFQLASSQAYFPWIIAGIVAVFTHTRQRWPPVLLAASAALLLFAGNLWYTLPMFIGAAAIVVVYLLVPRPVTEGKNAARFRVRVTLRLPALTALMLAAILTVGISAVILLPVWTNQGHIGKHPPAVKAGWVVPLWENIIPFYFNPDPGQKLQLFDPTNQQSHTWKVGELAEHYYSFITPLWFLALICVGIPLYRPRWNRLAWVAWMMAIFFTLWGAGGQPFFLWLYQNFPFIRGWRFIGRALAVASFWIALLVAMRLDSLWRIITATAWDTLGLKPFIARWLSRLLCGLLLLGSAVAAYQVNQSWYSLHSRVLNPIYVDDVCVSWLRTQYPDQPLTIWRHGYEGVTTLINNHVRIFNVTADFEMSPMPSTIASIDLTQSPPEFALPWSDEEWQFLAERGYIAVDGSPPLLDTRFPCSYRKPDTLGYAYTVPLRTLQAVKPQPPYHPYDNFEILPPSVTTPVTAYLRQPDNILLAVAGEPSGTTILTLQERAYPGWHVTVDGQPAKLHSVGGQLGIFLPSQPGLHQIYFEYRPPLLITSAWITLIASVFAMLYLLRVDRFLPNIFRLNRRERHNRGGERSAQ